MNKKGKRFRDKPDEPVRIIDDEPEDNDNNTAKRDERLREKNSKKLEKHMKKKKRREEKSDRSVLSYEEIPLDEREEERGRKTLNLNKKRVTVAVLIAVVLFVVVFLFANADRLSMHNITNFVQYGIFNQDSEERFPVNIQGEKISSGNFQRMGQDLCYSSDTKLQTLNNYGKSVFAVQHSYSKPVLVTAEGYSLLYNLGGTGYQINSNEEHLFDGEAENNILVADIVDNGTYALVTQSDGYLSKLFVYDKDNNQIFAYSFADYYITSVSLSPNGRNAVLSGLSAHNGSEISSLYVLDFTKDTPAQFTEFDENIIYEVQYLNDTYASAVGSSAACVINTRNGKTETVDYQGMMLTAFSVNKDTASFSVSLSRSGDGRNCEIWSFNTNGTLSRSFETDLRVIDMSIYKGRVALLSPNTVYLYGKDGRLISKADAGIDPHAVELYTSADAYVLNTSEINAVSM